MKIFIPISTNGSGDVKSGWAVSMVTELGGLDVHIQEMHDSLATRACNKMAAAFLKTECDAMLIIDCDIRFRRSDVLRMVSHLERGLKAVWGIYPKKSDETEPCLCTFETAPAPDEHGLAEVRRAGRGFMLVHRSVFEALKEENGGPALRYHNHGELQWDFFPILCATGKHSALGKGNDPDGFPIREYLSEDWVFCERLRDLGIPTLVDTHIALGHIGPKEFRFNLSQVARLDSNITSWRDIHGWFDYEPLYRAIVEKIPSGGNFAEVGCWLGRSIGAFHEFAKEAGKTINIHAVDTFKGDPANAIHKSILDAHGGSVESVFRGNMKALGLNGELFVHAGDSAVEGERARLLGVKFDAVFIDAAHDYESVKRDVEAWLPNVIKGGIICGHDFDEPGVNRAINELLPNAVQIGRCWSYQIA